MVVSEAGHVFAKVGGHQVDEKLAKAKMSRPGIEPGSMQPQCTILTTVRSRPIAAGDISIQIRILIFFL